MKYFKSKKGITLITLVVTIVVMIIIAGVSSSILVEQSGLIMEYKKNKDNLIETQENGSSGINDLYGELSKDNAEKTASNLNATVSNTNRNWNGKEQSFDISIDQEGSTAYYSTDDGTTWSTQKPAYVNRGLYKIKIQIVNPNYKTKIINLDFYIV